MKIRNIVLLALAITLTFSCVHKSKKCKKAHKNIKSLHLQNW